MNTLTIDHVTRRDLDTIYICQVDMSTFIGLLSLFQLSQGIGFFGFHQGNYIQELTSELRGFIWFFHYTFSYKVVSEIDSSNNFQSLYTAKSFLNWKVVLNNRQPSANTLNWTVILQLIDSIQATRCKVINISPTVSNAVSLYWVFLPNLTMSTFSKISIFSWRNPGTCSKENQLKLSHHRHGCRTHM